MRRILTLSLAFVLMLATFTCPVSALDEKEPDWGTRYAQSMTCGFTFGNNSTGCVTTACTGSVGTTQINATFTLYERYALVLWREIDSWYAPYHSSAFSRVTYFPYTSGTKYKAVLEVDVKTNGTWTSDSTENIKVAP